MRSLKWIDVKTKKGRRRIWDRIWRYGLKHWIWGGYHRGGLCGAYHWIRCHIWNRYHVVNFSGEDGYNWGWLDRDHALLLVCFKILKDFVELEDPEVGLCSVESLLSGPDDPMRPSVEAQVKQEREIRALYTWWTVDRVKDHTALPTLLDRPYTPTRGLEWWNAREALDKKDEAMLIRLMKIRKCLWT